jgi:predicted acetyltransferase
MMIEVRVAGESERLEIERMLDRYLIELSQHREIPAGAARAAEYPFLTYYWSERDRFPFTVWFNYELVGFALVRRCDGVFQFAEFFIESKHRRSGIGGRAVASIFKEFPGLWELQVMSGNASGLRFWQRCISAHATNWNVEQIAAPDGLRHFFHFEIRP